MLAGWIPTPIDEFDFFVDIIIFAGAGICFFIFVLNIFFTVDVKYKLALREYNNLGSSGDALGVIVIFAGDRTKVNNLANSALVTLGNKFILDIGFAIILLELFADGVSNIFVIGSVINNDKLWYIFSKLIINGVFGI
jgi:hypothetical protein